MEHRHLLPDEIDQLLDGEAGFGVAPLVAHVENCPKCRAQLAEAREVVSALERLPHFTPSPLFRDRVMAQVQVFEPWHVTALDTAKRWLPASRPARFIGLAATSVFALSVSLVEVWIAVRLDAFLFFFDLARPSQKLGGSSRFAPIASIPGRRGRAPRTGGVAAAVGVSGFLVLITRRSRAQGVVATARRRRTT